MPWRRPGARRPPSVTASTSTMASSGNGLNSASQSSEPFDVVPAANRASVDGSRAHGPIAVSPARSSVCSTTARPPVRLDHDARVRDRREVGHVHPDHAAGRDRVRRGRPARTSEPPSTVTTARSGAGRRCRSRAPRRRARPGSRCPRRSTRWCSHRRASSRGPVADGRRRPRRRRVGHDRRPRTSSTTTTAAATMRVRLLTATASGTSARRTRPPSAGRAGRGHAGRAGAGRAAAIRRASEHRRSRARARAAASATTGR